ncbi:MAG: helix-turn-helix domain-containing protein [Lachnospiraceae bacterium]|nr:helix-turn-helix domain-containing protein [Lachnospiraceae bacterium]
MKVKYYYIDDVLTLMPSNALFQLHTHDEYEIFLFLEGDANYIVEDKIYPLNPYDIIVIRKNELHRIYHNSVAPYRRITLHISPAFFHENNCTDYEAPFLDISSASGNKIPANIVRSSGLYDAFLRHKKYSDNFTKSEDTPILTAAIIEILYLVNQLTLVSTTDFSNGTLKEIISYLNEHFTEDITLNLLEDKFYISKYYLCRAFRKATGLTVHEYIRLKRLAMVRDLRAGGMNIGDAALQAGFHDYSAFYRAYKKEFGPAPGKNL